MSGSTIGGVVGAVIGFYFGGPTGAQWGWMIGSAVGGYVDPDIIEGPRLTDPRQQTSQEGVPRPIVYGTAVVAGNVIQVQAEPTERAKEDRTGKGGPVQKTYTYTRTVAIRLAEAAPLGGDFKLRRVWRNNKLVYDATGTGDLDAESGVFQSKLRFYSGSETQLPDSALEALPTEDGGGVGNVPAYRGTCYAVIEHDDVTEGGGALNQYMWEISSCASVTPATSDPLFVGNLATSASGPLYGDGTSMSVAPTPFGVQTGLAHVTGSTRAYFFGSGGSTVKFTEDEGNTYTTCTVPGTYQPAVSAASSAGAIYAIGSSGPLIRTTGSTFVACAGSGLNGIGSTTLFAEGSTVAVGYERQVGWNTILMVSEDNGATFTDSGLRTNEPGGVFPRVQRVFKSGAYYLAFLSNGEIFRGPSLFSLDRVVDKDFGGIVTAAPCNDGVVVAACDDKSVLRSTNYGSTWADVGASISDATSNYDNALAYSRGRLLLASNTSIDYSDDLGSTWSVTTTPGTDTRSVSGYGEVYTGLPVPDMPGYYWDPETGLVSGPGIDTVETCQVQLDDIVTDLCDREGVTIEDIDVSGISAITVRGYPIVSQTSASGAIKKLQEVFFFDFPEWGNSTDVRTKLRAILRGASPVATIDPDYSVESDEDVTTRAQSVEFPRKLHMMFVTPETLYQPVKETAERETENVKAQGEVTVDTAVIFSRDEGSVVADKALKVLWEEAQGSAEFGLPEEYSYLTPSDIITLEGRRYRINETELQDGELQIKGSRDRASAYTSTATGTDNLPVQNGPGGLRGPTIGMAYNAPRLHASDIGPGMYIAVTGPLPAWRGADIYLSIDGGATEQLVATIIDPAVMGYLTATLPVAGGTLSVRLYRDDVLDTITSEQADQRFNAFAIQTESVCEVGQFLTATDTGVRTYDLTDLRRGLLDTVENEHPAGELFTVLDGSLLFLPLDVSLSGQELIFRPVTLGTAPENNPTFTVLYLPQFIGPQVLEAYTDDSGEPYTDDNDVPYYKVIS